MVEYQTFTILFVVYKNFLFPKQKFNEEEIVDISAKDKIKSKCKILEKYFFT